MRVLLVFFVVTLAGIANADEEAKNSSCSCNGPNESLRSLPECPPPRTCENKGVRFNCVVSDERTVKCVCNQGFVRKSNGTCVKPVDCDSSCNGPNESLRSLPKCPPPRTCDNMDIRYKCAVSDERTVKCVCNQGFVRKSNGTCVKPVACDSSCNGPNESLRSLAECPPPRTCENRDIKYKCAVSDQRTVKCVCNQGFVRKSNGTCVKPVACDPPCTGPNEWLRCVPPCPPPPTCQNRHIAFRCAQPTTCSTQCVCKAGYYRKGRACVKAEECDPLKEIHQPDAEE